MEVPNAMACIEDPQEDRILGIVEMVNILFKRIENNKCDGEACDDNPHYQRCEGCRAIIVINEIGKILQEAL